MKSKYIVIEKYILWINYFKKHTGKKFEMWIKLIKLCIINYKVKKKFNTILKDLVSLRIIIYISISTTY